MGLLSGSMESLSLKPRRSSNASQDGEIVDGNENDTSTLDKDEGNVLMALIQQLRPGMDLSKIALPTFVLEPRSLLERITDFFSHPELIFSAGDEENPKERFLHVMTYYLSGWHIKPKGVKKPYNPVLGEFFRCSYTYPDGSEGFYVAEQVSHHPPVSAFFYVSPKNGVLITGELKPKSKFLGNSAATIMEGQNRVRLLKKPQDGDYEIGMPNMYARGILFGKMVLELGDISTVKNEKTDYACEVEFKTKGWISGGYNALAGHIRGPNRSDEGDINGHWNSSMEYVDKKSGQRRVLFDAAKSKVVPKTVLPEAEQEENESRRQWSKLTEAIKSADMIAATTAKTAVEDRQREIAKQREASGGSAPDTRFFKHVAGDKWMPKLDVDSLPKDPAEMEAKVREWIYGSKTPPSATAAGVATREKSTSIVSTASAASAASATSSVISEPPAAPTVPGPPAPGPRADKPIKSK